MLGKKLSVLIVDDDPDDLFFISRFLSAIDTFEITIATESNYNKARTKILLDEFDIYIVDYRLGPHTGIDLMQDCIKSGISKPFILLTGNGDRKIDLEATKAGAYDYLTKSDLSTELLERTIRYSMQRYSAYRTLAESEKKYREIFSQSNDIIFVLNNKFQLVDFNPMTTFLLGYTFDELYLQPIQIFFEKQDEASKFIHHMELNNAGSNMEIVLLNKDGEHKIFLASCSRIIDPEGLVQYQGLMHDYTTMKKSVAEQLLKEKMEATDRLVKSLAHEIRNPLTNINLSLYQLEEDSTEEKMVFIDIIKRSSKKIADLIGELMHLSSPLDKNYELVELKELVATVLTSVKDRIELKQIMVNQIFIPVDVFILGDRKKIQTAILNIILNAVEAVDDKNGEITIEISSGENNAFIKISDNGTGISTENLSYLFQPYFTGKKNGMGLG